MPPCHVLPLRPEGVVLEVEVPLTIFVEHTVGVVHPAVGRRVVIGGAVVLGVSQVGGVGIGHVLPAREGAQVAIVAVAAVYMNIKCQLLAVLIGREIKGHEIVDVVYGQTYVEGAHLLVIGHQLHVAHLGALLHRQHQEVLARGDAIDAMVATEKQLVGCGCCDVGSCLLCL